MILKSLSYKKLLNKIIKKSKLLEREKFMGDKLAMLLVYDVLFGMGVRGKFRSAMKRNYAELETALEHYMKKHECSSREQLLQVFDSFANLKKPKYIYLNRLMGKSKKEILSRLQEEGFELVKCENSDDEDEFKSHVDDLSQTQFIKDFHVKYLYVFKSDSILSKEHNASLFNEGCLLQIDKVNKLNYFLINIYYIKCNH